MSYLVLARKYRPQPFADLVGQEHVGQTLGNALASGRVAHAFLFTGVRGVGKTTSARILAKALNCHGANGDATGPMREPCNRCSACNEIAQGIDLDVQEIDGASYNGVDEVRRLQEGLAFRPARDRFKLFIVDEVHMLSTNAWNAFLKTLEEPPPHVKFIFATTEVHKVPITILSRCQRYDFKLIAASTIAKRLEAVLAAESIEADPGAVAILAREASGSMRDAMSLLDQVVAYAGSTLRESDVARVLGVADRTVLHDLGAALLNGQADRALEIVHALASEGYDIAQVCRDFLRHLRNLVVARVTGDGARALLDLPDGELADIRSMAALHQADDLTRCYQGFARAFDEVVRSPAPRASLEMALVRLARRPPLLPLDDLLVRLADLEKRVGGGTSRGPGRGPSPSSVAHVRHDFQAGGRFADEAPRLTIVAPQHEVTGFEGALATRTQPVVERPRLVAVEPSRPASLPKAPVTPVPRPVGDAAWLAVVEDLRVAAPATAAIYEHAMLAADDGTTLSVAIAPGDFLAEQAASPERLSELAAAARRTLGDATRVDLRLEAREGESLAHRGARERPERAAEARRLIVDDPGVRALVERFGAVVRDAKPASS